MKIRLSKTEKIAALLNQWDPTGRYGKSDDWRAYNYEADTIAQNVRANSKIESIEKSLYEQFSSSVEEAGKELDPVIVKRVAEAIKQTIKNK